MKKICEVQRQHTLSMHSIYYFNLGESNDNFSKKIKLSFRKATFYTLNCVEKLAAF